jgi:PPM family protein phosphatase
MPADPTDDTTEAAATAPAPTDEASSPDTDTAPVETAAEPTPPTQSRRKRAASTSDTQPQDEEVSRKAPSTRPLVEKEAERLPLQAGTLVAERYDVQELLSGSPAVNTYRVLDTQGYKRCWACGSTLSRQGDIYCADCGAELAGRHYRLQEYHLSPSENGDTPSLPLPAPILANQVSGVSHVYDLLADPLGEGRVYVAWEEDYGRTLASFMPDTTSLEEGADSPAQARQMERAPEGDEPNEEQIAAWMAQSAIVLAQLHAQGIVGCRMTLDNLVVQPGDRVIVMDASGCRDAAEDEDEADRDQLTDVRLLAGELERWYIAVRDVGAILGNLTGDEEGAEDGGMLRVQGAVFSAGEMTGPLAAVLNPVFVLARAREGEYPTALQLAEALQALYEQSKPLTNLTLWSGRGSHVGQVRQINEDSVLTLEATVLEHDGNLPVALYVIADGMGGHQSGEVASSIAARTVGAVINSSLIGPVVAGDPVARDPATCAALLRQSVLEANRRISELARERHSDLGTTLVAALVIGNQLTVANVGDSRAYLLREGKLSTLTVDHSLVMQLVLAGQITIDDIYTHPRRNEIYRALGDSRISEDEVDVFEHRLQPGDGLLLCSDGLWDFVRDPAIEKIVTGGDPSPQAACDSLIDEANRQGGEDNVSVIFTHVLAG